MKTRSPTISGVPYGPLPMSRATSLWNVIGLARSHSVLPLSASAAITTSSRGFPYMVYKTPFSTAGDE